METMDKPRTSGPRWMAWAVTACFVVSVGIGLLIDLNGNVVIADSLPDLLNPAPTLIMLLALGAGTTIATMHAARYRSKRLAWLAVSVFFLILTIVVVLPAL